MNFQNLAKVETPDAYIDLVFRAGRLAGEAEHERITGKHLARIMMSRQIEVKKMQGLGRAAVRVCENILKAYPSIDGLDPFYVALVKCTTDYVLLKKSLGAVAWARDAMHNLRDEALRKMRGAETIEDMNKHRTAFCGRVASVFKQIKKNLAYLEECRRVLKKFPAIKTSIPTVVIAGAPNVGKSTLLSVLTGASPKIASYPFTTQRLMLGYFKEGELKVQVIDTPGLLDRPLEERNVIERQAILALKHLAKLIVFVLDPSESCGYPFQEQLALLAEIKRSFDIPVFVVANKTDLQYEKKLAEDTLLMVAEKGEGVDKVRNEIIKRVQEIPVEV